jgi:hypothetical protein
MDLSSFEFETAHSKFKGFQYQNTKIANSIEPGQITWMCRLAWLYTGGKGLIVFG